MAELHPLSFSQDFIKWIFVVIRDESWDSCFSFLMILNRIHEMPAGVNWKAEVAFNGLQFSLFMLHTGTCVIFFSRFFFKGFWMGTCPFAEFPLCPIFLSPAWALLGRLCPFPDVTPHVMVTVCHHLWLGTRAGIVLSSNSPPPDLLRTQMFSFPITQKLIWLPGVFYISNNSLLTAQALYVPLAILIIIYPLAFIIA